MLTFVTTDCQNIQPSTDLAGTLEQIMRIGFWGSVMRSIAIQMSWCTYLQHTSEAAMRIEKAMRRSSPTHATCIGSCQPYLYMHIGQAIYS